MKTLCSLRTLLLALVVSLIPAASFGGVFISVNFAPPVLPVYDQPPCPEPGLIWNPGYWAYDEDGYYWVPGTWVPAPYAGALWTPPYWGWEGGLYIFHPGYWGTHVGYYGGVNYGFGYMGVGFVGGMWRGHDFIYNTAVMRVDDRYVRNVYVDRDVVRRYTLVNDRHVSFSGGRDGIHHDPLPEERFADRDRHVTETNFQQSHENAARSDRSYYARNHGGHPNNVVVQRPMNSGPNTFGNNRGQNPGNAGDPRSNQRGFDNRNTYTPPPNAGGQPNQNRDNNSQYRNTPQQDRNVQQQPQSNPHDRGFGDPRSNERGHDNRNTYNPPQNGGNQGPQYRGAPAPQQSAPQHSAPQPQFRSPNNPHGGQDTMQNRGGPPPQQQPQQPQQPRGDQGGHGNPGGDRGGHDDHGGGDRGHGHGR